MPDKRVFKLAKEIANGKIEIDSISCPFSGPKEIIIDKVSRHLISCDAFSTWVKSGRKDGRGCLRLHEKACNRGCPYEQFERLVIQ